MTPLMWAAYHSRPDHVRTLVERGADPTLQDIDGMYAIHWSIHKHDTRVLQVMALCYLRGYHTEKLPHIKVRVSVETMHTSTNFEMWLKC